jgi:hypothetical protein
MQLKTVVSSGSAPNDSGLLSPTKIKWFGKIDFREHERANVPVRKDGIKSGVFKGGSSRVNSSC